MLFTTPSFLFGFLPILLALYFICPEKLKNILLLIFSLLFYSWGEPVYITLLLVSILINYIAGLLISRTTTTNRKKTALSIGVALNIAILAYYKYRAFISSFLSDVLPISITLEGDIHLPIGISFFTFQAISYLVDSYKNKAPAQKNIITLALYISLFPQLIAGPIIRYADISKSLTRRRSTYLDVFIGAERFIIGLAKKMIIANPLGLVADEIFSNPVEQMSTGVLWIGAITFFFQIYFDFSAYSDMAIGLGRIFGFRFMENFNYPYVSTSIKEFWRRWHISLSTWFRDYLYIPLGGNRTSLSRTAFNLILVFTLCGLWHGASWNFIVWGLYHGVFLLLERSVFGELLNKLWTPIRRCYVFIMVLIGWVIFRCDSIIQAKAYIFGLFGNQGTIGSQYFSPMFIGAEWIYVILLSIIFSTPVFRNLRQHIPFYYSCEEESRNPRKAMPMSNFLFPIYLAFLLALLITSMSYVSSSTYQPFIYFKF